MNVLSLVANTGAELEGKQVLVRIEELFEEEIRHESCALHVNVLAVLLDHCGTSFNGRSMWELTDGRIDRCLAVLSTFLKTFAHGQPRRLEAALRVLDRKSVV